MSRLDHAIGERRLPYDIRLAQRRDVAWYDFLLVTRTINGRFVNVGLAGLEEVLQDNLKGILKPDKIETEAREVITREFGRLASNVDCASWN